MNKYIAEFIGTFALVLIGTGSVVVNQETDGSVGLIGIAFAFGTVVMSMIYIFGPISGAHINPAVTISFAIGKYFPIKEVPKYIIVQILGAIAASGVLRIMFPNNESLGWTLPSGSILQSFINEFVLTFFLMLSILGVSAHKRNESIAGLVIGLSLVGLILVGGPISGGAYNPARTLGPAILTGNMTALWLYMTSPVLGAIAATFCWKFVKAEKN